MLSKYVVVVSINWNSWRVQRIKKKHSLVWALFFSIVYHFLQDIGWVDNSRHYVNKTRVLITMQKLFYTSSRPVTMTTSLKSREDCTPPRNMYSPCSNPTARDNNSIRHRSLPAMTRRLSISLVCPSPRLSWSIRGLMCLYWAVHRWSLISHYLYRRPEFLPV